MTMDPKLMTDDELKAYLQGKKDTRDRLLNGLAVGLSIGVAIFMFILAGIRLSGWVS